MFFFFFFFQAEDGIRDHCVTGVQTCALPILAERSCSSSSVQIYGYPGAANHQRPYCGRDLCPHSFRRSEERRVGKECRSRWSTDREKEKRRKWREAGIINSNQQVVAVRSRRE